MYNQAFFNHHAYYVTQVAMENAMATDELKRSPDIHLDYRNDSTVTKIQKYNYLFSPQNIFEENLSFFQNCDQQDVKWSKVQTHGWMQWYAQLST